MTGPESDETAEDVDPRARGRREAAPGVMLVFSAGVPVSLSWSIPPAGLVLGREQLALYELVDPSTSRQHLALSRRDRTLWVEDLDSRNGTFVDGERVPPRRPVALRQGTVVRLGQSLLVAHDDVGPEHRVAVEGNFVCGPATTAALTRIRAVAGGNAHLLIQGESGTGKEHGALTFHEHSGARGALVWVNCAAIPEGIAERLLFGATEGAYTGASQSRGGYVQAASRGTLFLDEIAELNLAVQAKLLRVVETGEVLALGASRPERVALRICGATHKDLRAAVDQGSFRHDLFFRIGQPAVQLPPLRQRREEIPWLIHTAARSPDVRVGKRLGYGLDLSVGVAWIAQVGVSTPTWNNTDIVPTSRTPSDRGDGGATFAPEALMSRVLLGAAPSVALRWEL